MAKELLSHHRKALDEIAAFLIERESITGKEFMEIFHRIEAGESAGADAEETVSVQDTGMELQISDDRTIEGQTAIEDRKETEEQTEAGEEHHSKYQFSWETGEDNVDEK